MDQFDRETRLFVYQHFIREGRPPTSIETAGALGASPADVEAAYHRLADGRALVLTPGGTDVLMAHPLSAVPTPYRVGVLGRWWWGNCVWDALGIPVMLSSDGRVETTCPDCGDRLALVVAGGRLQQADGVVHFAVPAARWWDDIVFT